MLLEKINAGNHCNSSDKKDNGTSRIDRLWLEFSSRVLA